MPQTLNLVLWPRSGPDLGRDWAARVTCGLFQELAPEYIIDFPEQQRKGNNGRYMKLFPSLVKGPFFSSFDLF